MNLKIKLYSDNLKSIIIKIRYEKNKPMDKILFINLYKLVK